MLRKKRTMRAISRRRKVTLLLGTGVLLASELLMVGHRRGHLGGANTVVRCRAGHLFTTLWIPGASLKAVRLGWWRFQRCPVGKHWALVTPVNPSDLTEEERQLATQARDIRLP